MGKAVFRIGPLTQVLGVLAPGVGKGRGQLEPVGRAFVSVLARSSLLQMPEPSQ